jgi:hypothetical protein
MKNKLMIYQGGGYDGCFWEWNFGYFDDEGEWQSLGDSGCAGIKDYDTEAALAMARQIKAGKENGDLIPLSSAKQLRQLNDSCYAPEVVVRIACDLRDAGLANCKMVVTCDECGNDIPDDELDTIHFTDPVSNGGCSCVPQTKICDACFEAKVCCDCRERHSPEELYDSEPLFQGRCFAHAVRHAVEENPQPDLTALPEELVDTVQIWQELDRLDRLELTENQRDEWVECFDETLARLDWQFRKAYQQELAGFLAQLQRPASPVGGEPLLFPAMSP